MGFKVPTKGGLSYLHLILSICLLTIIFHVSWSRSASNNKFSHRGVRGSHGSSEQIVIKPISSSDRGRTNNLMDVRNASLGFQEIKVISMPGRSDKRDAWAVASSVSGFDVEVVNGVNGSRLPTKALPYTMDQKPSVIGCWRAHMDVLQDMVNRKVATLLVFEDDADWDVALKSQLVQYARGTRWILNQTDDAITVSPYGDGWDFMWLGHCGARVDPWDDRRFVIPRDPTVEPPSYRSYGMSPDMTHWYRATSTDVQARIVMSQYYGVCTASYAISLQGAKKILYHLSMNSFNRPIDLGLSDLCKHKNSSFTCVGPYPPLIGIHRPAGLKASWSDIEDYEGDMDQARSERVVFSVRMNMERLLNGSTTFRSQYGSITGVDELNIEEITASVGHPETVIISEQDGLY